MNKTTFDPSADIDTPEMLNELKRALSTLQIQPQSVVALWLPAEGDTAEIVVDDAEFSRNPEGDDWVIVASANRVSNLAEHFSNEISRLVRE